MNKITAVEYGTFLGNLLVFISIFLPWYHANIYGMDKFYTGIYLASSSMFFWILYLLPLLSGALLAGTILYHFNKDLSMVSPRVWILSFSVVMIIVIFITLAMTPIGLMSSVMNNMYIGGYTAITGVFISLIFSIYPPS